MKLEALAKDAGVPLRTLQWQAKEAMERGGTLQVKDRRYRVERVGREYRVEEIRDVVVDTTMNDADRRWMQAPEEKRREAILKAQLVALWEKRKPGTGYENFVEKLPERYEGLKITEASFFRWVKRVRRAKEQGVPPSYALLDSRGGSRGARKIDEEMAAFIEKLILAKPQRKVRRIWEYLRDRYGELTPSYATVDRWVRRYRETHAFIVAVAEDPERAQSVYRPAMGRMDADVHYRNQLWELDATPADIITADGVRLTISAAIDVFSRRVVVVLEETASFTTLGRLFRKAIRRLGVPERVKTDNGRDYRSNNFEAMCQRLNIEQILVPPYSGYYKPHIERFFRTMAHELFEELPGYIGHNVAERKALVNRQTFQQRLESIEKWRQEQKNGNNFAKKFALKKENRGMAVEIPLAREELAAWIDRWIEMYERRTHRGIGTSPLQRWEENEMPVRKISDARILDVMVGISEVKKITKKGIRFGGVTYQAPEMWEFVGEQVIVLSDDDLSRIYVYDSDYNYLFTATNDDYAGMSRAQFVQSGRKFSAKLRKAVKLLEELRREEGALMQEHIDKALDEVQANTTQEVGYEEKSDVTRSVAEALAAGGEEIHEEVRDESVVPVIDGRPVFATPYDRFVYELKNQCVSEKTKKLAEKYPDSWEAAVRAAS